MNIFAHMNGMMDENTMMNSSDGMMEGAMGGMFLMGILWIIFLLVLITLGIMIIIILFRKYFSSKPLKNHIEK